jgi:hypothetical protein
MEHEMTLALTALRANKDMLLTLMDVFVREPHLDWVSNGRYDASAVILEMVCVRCTRCCDTERYPEMNPRTAHDHQRPVVSFAF